MVPAEAPVGSTVTLRSHFLLYIQPFSTCHTLMESSVNHIVETRTDTRQVSLTLKKWTDICFLGLKRRKAKFIRVWWGTSRPRWRVTESIARVSISHPSDAEGFLPPHEIKQFELQGVVYISYFLFVLIPLTLLEAWVFSQVSCSLSEKCVFYTYAVVGTSFTNRPHLEDIVSKHFITNHFKVFGFFVLFLSKPKPAHSALILLSEVM